MLYFLCAVSALIAIIVFVKLKNRHYFGVVIGGVKRKRKDLATMSRDELEQLATDAAAEGYPIVVGWTFAALREEMGEASAWQIVWTAVASLDDGKVVEIMSAVLVGHVRAISELPSDSKIDLRCAFLLGRHFMREANKHRRKGGNEVTFKENRTRALAYLDYGRKLAKKMSRTGLAPSDKPYADEANAVYETAMYMQYKKPLKSNVGMGGGIVGGGG